MKVSIAYEITDFKWVSGFLNYTYHHLLSISNPKTRVVKLYRKKYIKKMRLINTKKASKLLGVNAQRIRQLIAAGRLPAQKVGRDWVIRERDLAKVADRKPGRPRKKSN